MTKKQELKILKKIAELQQEIAELRRTPQPVQIIERIILQPSNPMPQPQPWQPFQPWNPFNKPSITYYMNQQNKLLNEGRQPMISSGVSIELHGEG